MSSDRDGLTLVSLSRTVLHSLEAAEEAASEGSRRKSSICAAPCLSTWRRCSSPYARRAASSWRMNRTPARRRRRDRGAGQEHAFDYLDAPVSRVGALDVPIPASKLLEDHVLPGKSQILEALRAIVA